MLNQIKEHIKRCDIVLVFAGAGMSADSNLTTYKDTEGFYRDYPLYKELNKSYVSMMSYEGLMNDPYAAWGYFAHQYKLYTNAEPHEGYQKLLALCQAKEDYFIVTTNVDGLFKKAGFATEKIHEVHGTIHALQCSVPCSRNVWNTEGLNVEIDYSTMKALDHLPLCPQCGFVSRPNICMYGDTDETYVWEEADKKAKRFQEWRKKNQHKKVIIFEIGVGAEGLKRHLAKYRKAFTNTTVICINPEKDAIYGKDIIHIEEGCRDVFVQLSTMIETKLRQ